MSEENPFIFIDANFLVSFNRGSKLVSMEIEKITNRIDFGGDIFTLKADIEQINQNHFVAHINRIYDDLHDAISKTPDKIHSFKIYEKFRKFYLFYFQVENVTIYYIFK